MKDKTYIVRFICRDGNIEIWEHVFPDAATEHFSLFGPDDADIYSEIQLIERDWTKPEDECDTILERKVFE